MGVLAEETVELGKFKLHLALDNGGMIAAEDLRDVSMGAMLADLARAEAAGESPKKGTLQLLLWGMTRLFHREISADECFDLVLAHPILAEPLTRLFLAYLKLKAPDAGEAEPAETPAEAETEEATGKTS